MLKTLYRVIDVEKGLDKMQPEDSAENREINEKGMGGINAQLMIAKHLDRSSYGNLRRRPFLSWCKSRTGIQRILEAKKGLIEEKKTG